jgi:hypothetical protein
MIMEFNKKFNRGIDGFLLLTNDDEEYLCQFMNSLEADEFDKIYDNFADLLQYNTKFVAALRKEDLHIIVVCLIRIANSSFGSIRDGNISEREQLDDIIAEICTLVTMLKALENVEN